MRKTLILCILFSFALSGLARAQELHPIMRPDRETLREWIESYENAPKAYIDPHIKARRGSKSLLSHLQYTPVERDQVYCGNCWAWAGTGCLGGQDGSGILGEGRC